MYISHCLEVTEPCRPPDGFIVEPLYGCRRSVGGTSLLVRSGEVVCWRVRHLDAHRTWESRCQHVTRQMLVTLRVRARHRRSATSVLHFLSTRRVWCRCRRSSTFVFHVFPPSCYLDAMKKSIAVLPRDPDILSPEVTPTVYQLWSYTRVRSGLLLCVS